MKRPPQSLRQIFAWPLAIAVVSVVGLVAALTGDGLRDVLSWIALGVPILAVAWAMRARRS
jgi:hypothetical protein